MPDPHLSFPSPGQSTEEEKMPPPHARCLVLNRALRRRRAPNRGSTNCCCVEIDWAAQSGSKFFSRTFQEVATVSDYGDTPAQSGRHGAELDYLMQDRVSTNFEEESGGDSRESFYGDVASELILAWDFRWKQDLSLEFSAVSGCPFQSDSLVCRYSRKSQAVG